MACGVLTMCKVIIEHYPNLWHTMNNTHRSKFPFFLKLSAWICDGYSNCWAMGWFVMDHLDCTDITVCQMRADWEVIWKSVSFFENKCISHMIFALQLMRLTSLCGSITLYFNGISIWSRWQSENCCSTLIWCLISYVQVSI